ncbi:MerR family transcriptional regulator [Micromonospora sp. SH-82]|uniref:MerR family transcriptional regulator n=1 Tax=Micromonospora sp. SH-82 TaxID=3132938 RepID=UPI003EC028E6
MGTIKFYLREGLLPPGRLTSRNQAQYDEKHLRRLWLIRAFTTIGQLDLSSVQVLLSAIADDQLPVPELYGVVNRAMFPEDTAVGQDPSRDRSELAQAHSDVDGLLDDLGWRVPFGVPGRQTLAEVLAAMRRLGCGCGADYFLAYGRAAEQLTDLPPAGAAVERAAVVARTILIETAFAALRRMAQEHVVSTRLVPPLAPDPAA